MSLNCNYCGKIFTHRKSRKRHEIEQHKSSRNLCNKCDNSFSRTYYMKVHKCNGNYKNNNCGVISKYTDIGRDDDDESSSVGKNMFDGKIEHNREYSRECKYDNDESNSPTTDTDNISMKKKYMESWST